MNDPSNIPVDSADALSTLGLDQARVEAFLAATTEWNTMTGEAWKALCVLITFTQSKMQAWAKDFPEFFHGDTRLPNVACDTISNLIAQLCDCLVEGAILGNKTSVATLAYLAKHLTEMLRDVTELCVKNPAKHNAAFAALKKAAGSSEAWPVLGYANKSFNASAVEQAIEILGLGSELHMMGVAGKGNRGSPAAPIPGLVRELVVEVDGCRNVFKERHKNVLQLPANFLPADLQLIESARDAEGFVKVVLGHEPDAVKKVLVAAINAPDLCIESVTFWADRIIVPLIEARFGSPFVGHQAFKNIISSSHAHIEGDFRGKDCNESNAIYQQAKSKAVLSKAKALAKGEIKKALERLIKVKSKTA